MNGFLRGLEMDELILFDLHQPLSCATASVMRLLMTILIFLPLNAGATDPTEIGAISHLECERRLARSTQEISHLAQFLVTPTSSIGSEFSETTMAFLNEVFGPGSRVGCSLGFRYEAPGQRQVSSYAADTPDEVMDINGFELGHFWYDVGPDGLVDFYVQILVENSFEGAADLEFEARKDHFYANKPLAKPVRYRLQFEAPTHHFVERNEHRVLLMESRGVVQEKYKNLMIDTLNESLRALDHRCRESGHVCFGKTLEKVKDHYEVVLAPDISVERMTLVLRRWLGINGGSAVFEHQ